MYVGKIVLLKKKLRRLKKYKNFTDLHNKGKNSEKTSVEAETTPQVSKEEAHVASDPSIIRRRWP